MAHQPFNLKNVLLWAAIALGGFTFQAWAAAMFFAVFKSLANIASSSLR